MKSRYHKRYIIAAVLMVVVMTLRFINYTDLLNPYVLEYPEMVLARMEGFLRQMWPMMLSFLFLTLYCAINHKAVGKVFFFIAMALMITFEGYSSIIEPFVRSVEDFSEFEYNIEIILFGIFFIAAFVIMILNGAKPHLAKLIAGASVFVCLANMYIGLDIETLVLFFTKKTAPETSVRIVTNYLYFFLLLATYMLLAIFDFQSRKKAAASEVTLSSAEEQLSFLRESYENGEITEQDYNTKKSEIISRL